MNDWPTTPGIWTRDLRPWPPENPSARTDFVTCVSERTRVVFCGDRRLQALAMACFIMEGGASRLAMCAKNLYGITHSQNEYDCDHYPAIRFEGNAHDRSVGINTRFYRVYDDIDHCLKNWLWHLQKSAHYRHLWPLWQEGRDEEYIRAMRWIWANGNGEDPPAVVSLYRDWLERIGGREGVVV